MGKKSKSNVRNVEIMENNRSMDDQLYVNDKLASGSLEIKKKTIDDVEPETRKRSKDVEPEDEVSVSSLRVLRRASKKKRRKKMGHPIIVEDTAGEFPTVPLPLPLHHEQNIHPVVTSVSLGTFVHAKMKNCPKTKNRAWVTTAGSIKPNPDIEKIPKEPRESMEIENTEILSNGDKISLLTIPKESSPVVELNVADSNSQEPENSMDLNTEKSVTSLEINDQTNSRQLPRFYSFRNRVLVIMEPECKFCFHGKLKIRVLYGTVRIYGYTCNSATTKIPLTVYSPRAYSPLAIETIDSDESMPKNMTKIWETLEKDCNDRKLAKRLQLDVNAVEEGWSIMILEKFDDKLTNFLATNFPHHLFPRIDDPSNHSWRDSRRAEIVLQANLRFDDAHRSIVIDSRGIDDVADAIAYDWETKENSRTIIGGGKCVGKSTMSRYLVNKLLARAESVIFLDFDPGQAEFTPAGCISLTIVDEPLLGPNFTHLREPYFQLYVGSSDVTRCITQYIDGIGKIVELLNCDGKLSHRPVVVNTMGYCKGIGWDIMSYVIKALTPTDVVQILSRRTKNNFDDTLSRQVIDSQSLGWMSWRKDSTSMDKPTRHRLYVIYSEAETAIGPAESWNLEAHQQRELSMISYLSGIVKNNDEPTLTQIRGLSSSINATPPYVVPFAAMSVSLAGAFIPQVLSVMNGNIVALCGVDMETTEISNSEETVTSSYPRVLIRPPLSTFYGFGILRGVDMEKEQLFINTPVRSSRMKHVNCLVGSTNLPQSLLRLNDQDAPYTGSIYDLPTSRGPRRGYYRSRYQVTA